MNNAQMHGCKYEGWQCFHCGEVFTTAGGAAVHFGEVSGTKPGCLHKVELGNERGWLMEIRDLENKLSEWKDRAFFFGGECDRLTESKDDLRQQLEQAEARCAEAVRCLDAVAGKAELGSSVMRAERSEPMDHAADGFDVIKEYAKSHASRLRQQAAEIERSNQGDAQ